MTTDELAPLDVDGVRAVSVGTAAWGILTVLALVLHEQLEDSGHGWWLGVCVAGLVLGLIGIPIVVRRRRRLGADPDPR